MFSIQFRVQGDVQMRRAAFAILFALATLVVAHVPGQCGGVDILTPEERLWLSQNQSRIVLAVETAYAPFVFIDADGKPAGLAHDYMRAVEDKLGVVFRQQQFPTLSSIFDASKTGGVQIVNAITKTPWRSSFLNITEPYVTIPNIIIARNDWAGRSLDETGLHGLNVSLVKSYAVTEYLLGRNLGFKADLVADDLSALLDVSFGRSDVAIIDLATASRLISGRGIANLRFAGQISFDIRLSMGTPLAEPELFGILEKGLAAVTDAERRDIHDRWIYVAGPNILVSSGFWIALWIAIAIVVLIITLVLVWNRMLRIQAATHVKALEREQAQYHETLECQVAERTSELFAASRKLEEVGEKFRAVLEASPVPQAINDTAGNIVYLNRAFSDTFGYTATDIPTLADWWPLAYPDEQYSRFVASSWHQRMEEAGQSLNSFRPLEVDIRCKNGDTRTVLASATSIATSFENTHLVTLYDITEQKSLRTSLHERMQELAVILDNSSVGITFVRNRQQVMANNRMAELFGYSLAEMNSKGTRLFYVSDEDYRSLGEEAYPILACGKRYIKEQEMLRRDGSRFWVRMSGKAISADDASVGSIWTFEEISSQKQTESDLRQARDAAETATKAKSEFLAMMSHEIRTPITGMLGMADLLRRTNLNEEQLSYLDTLAASTKTLLTILNDILDISKIEAGKIELETVQFCPADAIRDTVAMFLAHATAKSLSLTTEFGPNVPVEVAGDPARFKQLLFNLTSNALKFTEAGAVVIRLLHLATYAGTVTLRVEVEDTGKGIAAEQLPQLFQPFSQLDASTSRRFGGTGLGLVITKRLIELMGGEIGVVSCPGQGTLIWFQLPFLPLRGGVAPWTETAATAPLAAFRPLRLLVAEDNKINQRLLRVMLGKLGHEVCIADNGQKAVEMVVEGDFDAVLMDMQMPEMNGDEATRAIRAMPPFKNRIPIIALTADAMLDQRDGYFKAGVDDLVPKPIDWDVLSAALMKVTSKGPR